MYFYTCVPKAYGQPFFFHWHITSCTNFTNRLWNTKVIATFYGICDVTPLPRILFQSNFQLPVRIRCPVRIRWLYLMLMHSGFCFFFKNVLLEWLNPQILVLRIKKVHKLCCSCEKNLEKFWIFLFLQRLQGKINIPNW